MKNTEDSEFYKENGFAVFKNLLTAEEVSHYQSLMKNVFPDVTSNCTEAGKSFFSWAIADGIRKRKEFWPIIWQENIIKKVRKVLGDEIKFCIHNDLHYNITQAAFEDGNPQKISGWHRDSRFRGQLLSRKSWFDKIRGLGYQDIWDESEHPVKMARLGIYLTSYEEHQTPVFLIPGSHLSERSLSSVFERLLWNKLVSGIRCFLQGDRRPRIFPYIRSKSHPFCLPAKPFKALMNAGDAVLFDMRMIHGIGKRSGERVAMFLDYGFENIHTFDHINYYLKERKDMVYLNPTPPELEKKLKEKNLFFEGRESFKGSPMTGRMSKKPEQNILDIYN